MAAVVVAVTAAASAEAVAFVAAVLTVGFTVPLTAVAFAAVGDPYNQPAYQSSAGYRRGEVDPSVLFSKTGE